MEVLEGPNDLTYVDDDFHLEISADFYHHCLVLVNENNEEGIFNEGAPEPARRESSRGRAVRLPYRYRE